MRLCRISLEDGRCGPIGVDLMVSKTSSKVLPEALAVASDFFYSFDLPFSKSI